jgi:hypothetical protein
MYHALVFPCVCEKIAPSNADNINNINNINNGNTNNSKTAGRNVCGA